MDDVFDWRYAGDGIFGENGGELEGKSAGEFAVEIDGTAAHAGDDAGALDLGTFELDEDDGLAGPKENAHHSDYLEVELFRLVAGEDGGDVALQARSYVVWRK